MLSSFKHEQVYSLQGPGERWTQIRHIKQTCLCNMQRLFKAVKWYEPRHEKTGFLQMRKQRRTAKLISSFVFATRILQSLYFLNPKFQASSHLLWLYSPVCVRPGRKPRRPVFLYRQTPWWPRPKAIHFSWLGPELSSVAWSTGAQLIIFFCFRFSVVLFDRPGISIRHAIHYICRVLVFASS